MREKKHNFPLINFILIALSTLLLTGCNFDQGKSNSRLSELRGGDTLENDYAKCFQIIYFKDTTKINILNPENGEIRKVYKISGKQEKKYNYFSRNIKRVTTSSTTQIGMLRALHLEGKIVGIPSYSYLCHPIDKSKVEEVGNIGQGRAEAYAAVQPDIIFYSGFVKSAPLFNKLKQAHLKTFLIYDWKETHPLGRAEWIKVYGVLFNKEKEANAIFSRVEMEYLRLKKRLKQAKNRPTVLAGTYFSGVFNCPAGDSYMAQLLKDANVDYVYANTEGTGSLSLGLEQVILENKEVKFWINAAASSRMELLQQSQKFKLLSSFQNRELYSYYDNLNCFWESSIIQPQIVLKDLGKIFHPELFEKEALKYYSRLE